MGKHCRKLVYSVVSIANIIVINMHEIMHVGVYTSLL